MANSNVLFGLSIFWNGDLGLSIFWNSDFKMNVVFYFSLLLMTCLKEASLEN